MRDLVLRARLSVPAQQACNVETVRHSRQAADGVRMAGQSAYTDAQARTRLPAWRNLPLLTLTTFAFDVQCHTYTHSLTPLSARRARD